MRQRGALQVLEESVELLRSQPAGTLAVYLLGAVPFNAGLLYFATDMARNPFAPERLPFESLLLAVLLVWKSVFQAVFAARMYSDLSLTEPPPVPWLHVVAVQAAFQPLSLILLPIALLITLPFPASVAFFRSVGLFAALGDARPTAAASQNARLWLGQNSVILTFISLAALLLFANVVIAMVLLPQLGRSFLGIEGEFARLGVGILNFYTLAVSITVAWMFIDPLLEAAYVIRCFHGQSQSTGQDLSVALRRIAAGAVLAGVLLGIGTTPALAQETPATAQSSAPQSSMDTQRLDDSIHQVIRQREFAWRTGRPPGEEPEGKWVGWFRGAWNAMKDAGVWLSERIREWFRSDEEVSNGKAGSGGIPPLKTWMALAALALTGGAIVLFLSRRNPAAVQPTPVATAAAVNLADDSVTADQLPESSWLILASELLANGDRRLALRALYLAGLNHLGELQLVSIRRWKTGRDYRNELERRARARNSTSSDAITQVFARCVRHFEQGWYGRHAVEPAHVEELASGLEEMRRHARAK